MTRREARGARGEGPRFRGSLGSLSVDDLTALLDRSTSSDAGVRQRTADIIARVRREGDAALFAMAREFDRAALASLEVPRAHWQAALDGLPAALRRAMERTAANVASVHRAWVPAPIETSPEPGIVIGRRPDPLGSVGVYAPGGRATYPSSVLMGAIPARVAGVREVILCSPPGAGPDGLPSPVLLAAAELANVDRVFAIGGAGAIAAMAYGTDSVPRVDRIVGPGNAYVAEAKLQVAGAVAIDSPAGPSELLVLCDASASPDAIAQELLAQAEHDPDACVVAVCVGEATADDVERALARLLPDAPRREIIAAALAGQGGLLWTDSRDEAIAFAARYAAEHLIVALADPSPGSGQAADAVLPRLRNAGTIFVGERASNAFGDYMTGANHVLPTGGLARSYSGLSTLDFVRWTTYQRVDAAAAARLAPDVATFAEAEALPGHAAAARRAGGLSALGARRSAESVEGGSLSGAVSREPSAASLARAEIRALPLYAPDQGTCAIDVSDNTNLWGMPPAAERAIREVAVERVTRYPSLYAGPLREALLAYVGVPGLSVVTGCGSDDVLDATMRAFGAPGDRIAYSTPTFSMIPTFARINGLEPVAVPYGDGWDVDAERLVATGAKLIYLCAPNNPTATTLSRAAVEHVVDRAPGIVILDEAYAEFAARTHVDLAARGERLLVTRTLSKAFGLAGLRVGYAVGARPLVEMVERARGPYKVNALAERAALAALDDGPEGLGWVRAHVALAIEHRARLSAALGALDLHPLPSDANFVFVPTPRAAALARRLRERGILVRTHTGLPTVGDALRIGVGPWEIMERVLEALR